MLPNIEVFSEALDGLPIFFQIDLHSGYHQQILHKDSRDIMACQTMQGMNWPNKLEHGATNSRTAFVRVFRKIPNSHLGSITETVVDYVIVKRLLSQNRE
jgi:hypothetical protein